MCLLVVRRSGCCLLLLLLLLLAGCASPASPASLTHSLICHSYTHSLLSLDHFFFPTTLQPSSSSSSYMTISTSRTASLLFSSPHPDHPAKAPPSD
ncbi:hypothetical protein BKA61DRAFT_593949 [Leptodontidium sp. MPI-SDFR-AT-0119]|nr:hypothetical protein BKA61DRAFT_593949 [Leptodontidium sp. MPI-SDFR-AT-0119]